MPPFGPPDGTLADDERWSLVAFLYTLSTPQGQMDKGKALYAANCAGCHGESGKGDGPLAGGQAMPSFTDQAFMAAKSQADFFKSVKDASAHASVSALNGDERWAAVDYVRAFSY